MDAATYGMTLIAKTDGTWQGRPAHLRLLAAGGGMWCVAVQWLTGCNCVDLHWCGGSDEAAELFGASL